MGEGRLGAAAAPPRPRRRPPLGPAPAAGQPKALWGGGRARGGFHPHARSHRLGGGVRHEALGRPGRGHRPPQDSATR
eukprot:6803984-Lingulodinium_polyedra.AAC.1